MNCRETELLLQAERDGALTELQCADLERHLGACPVCREFRATLVRIGELVRADAASVKAPDAEAEWRRLQARLQHEDVPLPRKRRLAPVYWLGAPLAAAAAVALAFFVQRQPAPTPVVAPETPAAVPLVAAAEYVEVSDRNASPVVYVDKESGWLVVWAVDTASENSG